MSELIIVNGLNDTQIQKGWKDSYSEQEKILHQGRLYKIIALHELPYSEGERVGRALLAILAIIVTLGIALVSSQLRSFFTEYAKATKTFAVPHKVVTPNEPDPTGKLYPQETDTYERLLRDMDPEAIRTAIDAISDFSINKDEIINFMLLKILEKKLPRDLEELKADIAARHQIVKILITSGIDLNETEMALYYDNVHALTSRTDCAQSMLDIKFSTGEDGWSVRKTIRMISNTFLDTLLDKMLERCGWSKFGSANLDDDVDVNDFNEIFKQRPFPEPAVYMPIVKLCKPLINLLLLNGATTFDEQYDHIPVNVEWRKKNALVANLRQELKFVQHGLPGAYDPGSPFSTLPIEVTHLIGKVLLNIPADSER